MAIIGNLHTKQIYGFTVLLLFLGLRKRYFTKKNKCPPATCSSVLLPLSPLRNLITRLNNFTPRSKLKYSSKSVLCLMFYNSQAQWQSRERVLEFSWVAASWSGSSYGRRELCNSCSFPTPSACLAMRCFSSLAAITLKWLEPPFLTLITG